MKTYGKRPNKLIYALFLPMVLAVFFIISCKDNNQNLSGPEAVNGDNSAITANPDTQNSSNKNIAIMDTVANKVYDIVDNQPEPVGGMTEFYNYIAQNLKYPEQARKNGTEGKVYVRFIVDKDGGIKNVGILRGIGSGCDNAAIDIIANAANWKPGIKDGDPVATRLVLPILFKLGEK